MKKTSMFLFAVFAASGLAGCGHEHNFDTKWSYDANGHFHVCECGEHDKSEPHEFGKWYTKTEATREKYGVAERKCEICSYKETKKIDKLVYKLIEVYNGTEKVTEFRTDADGNYTLEVPADQEGAYFAGYFDSTDAPFPLYGHIEDDIAIQMHVLDEPFLVDTEANLDLALRSSMRTVRTNSSLLITYPHYVLSSITFKATSTTNFIRATNYAGDMFVVGVDGDYNEVAKEGHVVSLTMDASEAAININGNSTSTTVDVEGSAFFVAGMSELNLNGDVNVLYHHKVKNNRVLPYDKDSGDIQRITKAKKVGGAAIINIDSTLNINGASFEYNEVNDGSSAPEGEVIESSYGGAIFSTGPINIDDGTFSYNTGSYGSVFYALRNTVIKKGVFSHNLSYDYGTAYFGDSQYSNAYLNAETEGAITFSDNTANGSGGAIFVAGLATLEGSKIHFLNNTSGSNGGAINAKGDMTLDNCKFEGNSSDSKGGAIYYYYGDKTEVDEPNTAVVNNCLFKSNSGALGGAIGVGSQVDKDDDNYSEVTKYPTLNSNNCVFENNSAVLSSASKYGHGGAVYTQKGARTNFVGAEFTNNTAVGHGGVGYHAYASQTTYSSTTFTENSCGSNGGALYVTQRAHVDCTSVTAKDNSTATGLGGFIYVGANSMPSTATLTDIDSMDNSAKEGGFAYVTTTNCSLTINSGSTSGCTATAGAAKNNIVTNHSTCIIYINLSDFTYDGTLHTGKGSVQDISPNAE